MKIVGGFRRSRYVGLERTGLCGEMVATAYNLVRMSRLIAEQEAEVPVSVSVPWSRCAPQTPAGALRERPEIMTSLKIAGMKDPTGLQSALRCPEKSSSAAC